MLIPVLDAWKESTKDGVSVVLLCQLELIKEINPVFIVNYSTVSRQSANV